MNGELYIPNSQLPKGTKEFVAWVDIMGSRNIFQKSLKTATTYILKLNQLFSNILIESKLINYKYYPIIDGFYFTYRYKKGFLKVMQKLFIETSNIFMSERRYGYRFMIRAGLSYGEVIHGKHIKINELELPKETKENLLFGKALVDCCAVEKEAPPFSISIYPGAIEHYDTEKTLLDWYNTLEIADIEKFKNEVLKTYLWLDENQAWCNYKKLKQKEHLNKFLKMLE